MKTGLDYKAIKAELDNTEAEMYDGEMIKSVYLGTCFDLLPSGKYYMPWACSNVTEDEANQDEAWYNEVESKLGELGIYLESGEGDPCDLYICKIID